MNRHSRFAMCLVISAGLACVASAQQDRPAPPAEGEKPVLRGPRVGGERPPGVREEFGGEKMGRDALPANRAPMREFLAAMMVLDGEDTPDPLRLSEQQHEQLRELMGGPRGPDRRVEGQARRAEGEGRRPEGEPRPGRGPADGQRGPRGEGARGEGADREGVKRDDARRGPPTGAPEGAGRGEADRAQDRRPPQGDAPRAERRRAPEMLEMTDEMDAPRGERPRGPQGERGARNGRGPEGAQGVGPEARERAAANAAEMQTRAWSILNEGQRAYVKSELERIRAEQGEEELNKRAADYLRKRREGAAQGGPTPAQGFGEKGAPNSDRAGAKGDRAKRLSEMSPEEREAAVEKFRSRAERERRRGETKPPPPIEDLTPRDPE